MMRPPPLTRRPAAYVGAGLLIAVVIGAFMVIPDDPADAAARDAAGAASRFIAVLPFANTSPDSANEFFADGVTEDILTQLAQVPHLGVISRTTTIGYKGTQKSVREIAEELGVRYVLEGTVRRSDDRVRITAWLVDGSADQQLWVGNYERELADVFEVQAEIARAIVDALQLELSTGVAARLARQPTPDIEAYDLFLLGRESLYRYDPQGIQAAMTFFRRALERDAGFTLARAWYARALAMHVHNQGLGPEWADSAVAAARLAVEHQPDLPDAYTALGTALWGAGRYTPGVAALERALGLNPNDAIATHNLGGLSAWRGDYDEAIRLTRRSLVLEPARSHRANENLTYHYAVLGLFDRAEAALERARAVAPDAQGVLYSQARLELMRGRLGAVRAAAAQLAAQGADNPGAAQDAAHLFVAAGELEAAREAAAIAYAHSPVAMRSYLIGVLFGHALAATGAPARARQVLAETERYATERIAAGHEAAALRYSLACIHALRGERDAAFHWLDEAIRHGWNAAPLTAADPLLAGLQGDPRFDAALHRMERELATMRARVERGTG